MNTVLTQTPEAILVGHTDGRTGAGQVEIMAGAECLVFSTQAELDCFLRAVLNLRQRVFGARTQDLIDVRELY